MTDITELAQSLKGAANKAGADYWQAKKISGDFYVIRKGSYSSKCGYCTYQPIAEIDHKSTRDYVAIASPSNILALVEALEKAQAKADIYDMLRNDYGLREKGVGLADFVDWQAKRIAELERQLNVAENNEIDARCFIAELESRTVTLPKPKDSDPGWKIDPEFISKVQNAIGYDDQCECWEGTPSMEVVEAVLLAAAGIKVEAE